MTRPRDPLSDIAQLSHTYAAEDFMAQRKRLREARARWIEEHERPTDYVLKNPDGKVTYSGGPFQIGQRKYEGEYPQTPESAFQPTFKPEPDNPTATKDLDDLDAILAETGDFLAPGIYRESAHPEIREGEDYGEYCARVGREYEAATGANAVRRPVPDSDGVRESASPGESGQRGAPVLGAGDSGCLREHPGGDAGADDHGDTQPGDAARTTGDASADGPADRVPSS